MGSRHPHSTNTYRRDIGIHFEPPTFEREHWYDIMWLYSTTSGGSKEDTIWLINIAMENHYF